MNKGLAQEAWEASRATNIREALERDPELRAICKKYGWFQKLIEEAEAEERG